jgi:WS/DGAT/MGAT family acyltransferase
VPDDRLSTLDESFLRLESESAHMHVAALMIFKGKPPTHDELLETVAARLHLVPRYRQRLAPVPLGQGRPRWVDDPHLNLHYHVRASALPPPGSEDELRALAGRVFSQQLDRDKPLWELWLVHGVEGGRFAIISKTHHALVDGIAGVDILTVLFDLEPDPDERPAEDGGFVPRPLPSSAQLLGEALLERAASPARAAGSALDVARSPRRIAGAAVGAVGGLASMAASGLRPGSATPYNQAIGPHRRFAWVRCSLDEVKRVKDALGTTVNDVMLATVAGALRRHMQRRGVSSDGLELKAMVPISVRSEGSSGGNEVTAVMARLPVAEPDARRRLQAVQSEMDGLKEGGQAVGAQALTELSGFGAPTVMSQAARLAAQQRIFNLVITNVPGPQVPIYVLGRQLEDVFPLVPLTHNQALGVAIMSYNGSINFGLNADYDAIPDLDDLADDIRASLDELSAAAEEQDGRSGGGGRGRKAAATSGSRRRKSAKSSGNSSGRGKNAGKAKSSSRSKSTTRSGNSSSGSKGSKSSSSSSSGSKSSKSGTSSKSSSRAKSAARS